MTAPGSPSTIPRQSSLQRALSELDSKSNAEISTASKKKLNKANSSLQRELGKAKAESFLEQYERMAEQRGMTRL